MINKLPLNINEIVFSFKPFDVSRLAIVGSFDNINLDYYTNYVNFKYTVDEDNRYIEIEYYEEVSQLVVKKVPAFCIEEHLSVVELCKKAIDKGMYIFLPVDTVPIINYEQHVGLDFFPHYLLISGYDTDNCIFYGSDFFKFSSGKYKIEEIGFHDIETAYANILKYVNVLKDNEDRKDDWLRDIELLYPRKNTADSFTIKYLVNTMKHYMQGEDSKGNLPINGIYYGYTIYMVITLYTHWCINGEVEKFDIRQYCLIRDRMKYMSKQCNIIIDIYKASNLIVIEENYGRLLEMADLVVNMCLRYLISKDKKILDKVLLKVHNIALGDYKNTLDYIHKLENIQNYKGEV